MAIILPISASSHLAHISTDSRIPASSNVTQTINEVLGTHVDLRTKVRLNVLREPDLDRRSALTLFSSVAVVLDRYFKNQELEIILSHEEWTRHASEIVQVLCSHLEGLTPAEIGQLLGNKKGLKKILAEHVLPKAIQEIRKPKDPEPSSTSENTFWKELSDIDPSLIIDISLAPLIGAAMMSPSEIGGGAMTRAMALGALVETGRLGEVLEKDPTMRQFLGWCLDRKAVRNLVGIQYAEACKTLLQAAEPTGWRGVVTFWNDTRGWTVPNRPSAQAKGKISGVINVNRFVPGSSIHPQVPAKEDFIFQQMFLWGQELQPAPIRRAADRVYRMAPEERHAIEMARLDLGIDPQLRTATWFYGMVPTLNLGRILNAIKEPLMIGSFGAGYITFKDSRRRMARFYREAGLGLIPGITVEPRELAATYLPGDRSGLVHVFDIDTRVMADLRDTRDYLCPLFEHNDTPLSPKLTTFATNFTGQHEQVQRVSMHGKEFFKMRLSEKQRQKIRPHHIDFSTTQLPDLRTTDYPKSDRLHVALYTQVHYFLDPILRKVAFLNILDKIAEGGVVVTDFLLTEAETSMLGLQHISDYEAAAVTQGAEGRDTTFFSYQVVERKIIDTLSSRVLGALRKR